jgi:hypothetical protein
MSKMLKFYESLLAAAGLTTTSDGCVSIKTSKDPKPLTLKGKRLVLPTSEHLRHSDRDSKVVFHPLTENVMRGESEVFERFRMALNGRINVVFGTVMHCLLQLGTSQAEQHKLSPEQSEFLSKVKNADEKTLLALKKVMDSVSATQHQKLFVSMFIKRGGTVGDKRFARVGVVHFPFYNDLKKAEPEFHGVKLRVKDREALIGLLDYILPEQDIAGVYNRGSNSTIAPSLEALMLSFLAIAAPLNDLIARFEGVLPDNLQIDADWVETMGNLDILLPEIRSVPMQAGNEGVVPGQEGVAAAAAESVVAGPVASTHFGSVASQAAGAGVSFGNQRPATTFGSIAPAPAVAGFAQAPASTPVARTPGGGSDFETLLRSNPKLQQAVGYGSQHGWNPGQSWQQTPSGPQRASLSNPVGPTQQQWGNQGTWGQQQQGGWGNNQGGGGWGGNSNVRL